jgi:hypothetical protein
LKQLTDFHETWYERYAIGGRLKVAFLITSVNYNSRADLPTYEVKAPFMFVSWNDESWYILEMFTSPAYVIFNIIYMGKARGFANFLGFQFYDRP